MVGINFTMVYANTRGLVLKIINTFWTKLKNSYRYFLCYFAKIACEFFYW
jgi:hypothetical protein